MATSTQIELGQLFLGVDGGGTKCRASLFSADNKVLGTGVSGPANPYHGYAETKSSILNAVEVALGQAGLTHTAASGIIAGIGLAGVNLPSVFNEMNHWDHPFKAMYLTTDLHIACLGAHNCDQGAVMVVGTGSCGYSFVGGKATMLGGHGFLLGDKCSGAWFGLEAVKAALLASDNLGPDTCLKDLVSNYVDAKGVMIVDKLSGARASDYAQLAHLVLEAADNNDAIAIKIMAEGAGYINALAEKLWATKPGRMSLLGGLSEKLVPWLKPGVVKNLSDSISPPEFGAVYYARQRHFQANNQPV